MPTGCEIIEPREPSTLYEIICNNCGKTAWYASGKSLKSAKKSAELTMRLAKKFTCEFCGASLISNGEGNASE